MRNILVVLLSLWFSASAWAGRTLKVPPISLVTVHGGMLDNGGKPQVCSSAGMISVPSAAWAPTCVYHQVNFHLKNLSPTKQQHISVTLESGTYLYSNNSKGATLAASTNPNPSNFNLTTPLQAASFTLDANASIEYRVTFACDNASCNLVDNKKGELYSVGTKFTCDSANASPPQVCIDLRSLTIPVFTITEDEGAIVGTVTTVAHRVGGWIDTHLTSPSSYQMNGGRPF